MQQVGVNVKKVSDQKRSFSLEYRWFLDISSPFFGINQRTINFLNEFHTFSPNLKLLNEQLREIALNDIWFYRSHQEAYKALKIIINFFREFLNKGLDYHNKERALKTLLEFVQILHENQNIEVDFASLISEVINILEKTLSDDEEIIIHEKVLLESDQLIRNHAVNCQSSGKVEALLWANKILFSVSFMNATDSIIKEQMNGKVHWGNLTYAIYDEFKTKIHWSEKPEFDIPILDASKNKIFNKVTKWLNEQINSSNS